MRKKIGNKFISLSVSTPDGKDLAQRLQLLVWTYLDGTRSHDSASETIDLAAFMLYCSYVSRNADDFGLDDFDFDYSIDAALDNLGNKYLATDFIGYYAGLHAQNPILLDLKGASFRSRDLSKAITSWASLLDASGLSLLEDSKFGSARAIEAVLADAMTADIWGRGAGQFTSPIPIAEAVARLANVEGKNVLDFACGNGIYLATALMHGAKSVCGRDCDVNAVTRASILCFFADPSRTHNISVANALMANPAAKPTQKVLVAPPLGVPLRDYDVPDKNYYAATLDELIGEGSPRPQKLEDFCVAKALASLEDDGIAVLHVSTSFLFHQQRGREAVRRAIVEKGYLRAVIELPGGCIPGSSVKSALLVLRKAPTDEGVLIIDFDSKEIADEGYVVKGRGKCEITEAGIDWLVKTVENREETALVSTVADREAILSSGSNLCYSAYGSVYDFQSVLDQTRSTADIVGDIQTARTAVENLGTQIDGLLIALDMDGGR